VSSSSCRRELRARRNYARHARGYKLAANLHVRINARGATRRADRVRKPVERQRVARLHIAYDLLGNERRKRERERESLYSCYYRTYIDPANSRHVHGRGAYPFVTRARAIDITQRLTYCDDCAAGWTDSRDSTAKLIGLNVNRTVSFAFDQSLSTAIVPIYLLKVTRIFQSLFLASRSVSQVSPNDIVIKMIAGAQHNFQLIWKLRNLQS